MPLTIPTHPIAVVPLKIWRPRWFDGVALVIGTMAPDLAYAIYGFGILPRTHNLPSLVWWSLPVTLVLTRLVRWAAPGVAGHLRLGDYGVLGTVRHRWYVTVGSALLGAFSHLVWDAFTHPGYLSWWGPLSDASNVAGFVVGTYLVVRIGRSGLLRTWHGAPPRFSPRPLAFWPMVAGVAGCGLAAVLAWPVDWFAGQAIRVLVICGLALLAGAVAARRGLFSG